VLGTRSGWGLEGFRGKGKGIGEGYSCNVTECLANRDVSLVVAVQCVSVGVQRHGRAICAYGEFEDPVQSAEQGGV